MIQSIVFRILIVTDIDAMCLHNLKTNIFRMAWFSKHLLVN